MAPRIRPLTPEEAPADAQPIFSSFLKERGNIPNMFRTLALRPEIMQSYFAVLRSVTYSGTLDVRLKELAMLRTSQVNQTVY